MEESHHVNIDAARQSALVFPSVEVGPPILEKAGGGNCGWERNGSALTHPPEFCRAEFYPTAAWLQAAAVV